MNKWLVYGFLKEKYTKTGGTPDAKTIIEKFMTDEAKQDVDMFNQYLEEIMEGYLEFGLVIDREQMHVEQKAKADL